MTYHVLIYSGYHLSSVLNIQTVYNDIRRISANVLMCYVTIVFNIYLIYIQSVLSIIRYYVNVYDVGNILYLQCTYLVFY